MISVKVKLLDRGSLDLIVKFQSEREEVTPNIFSLQKHLARQECLVCVSHMVDKYRGLA